MSGEYKPLSDDDLVLCLRELCRDSSITIDNLKCPKAPFIVSVFQAFLAGVEVNMDLIYTPPFKISNAIENMEFYEEILPLTTLKVLVSHILKYTGINDLSIKDVLEPKPKRTKRIISILMTFWRYTLLKVNIYDDLVTEQQAEMDQKQELFNEIELTKQAIKDAESCLENKKELLSAYKKNQARFDELGEMKDALNEKYQKSKSRLANNNLKQRELAVQIESQKEKLLELDQKILKSPKRLDAEKDQYRQKIIDVENKIKEIQSQSVEGKKLCSTLKDGCELLLKCNENIDTICSISEELREAATLVHSSVTRHNEIEGNAKRMNDEMEKEVEQKLLNEQWLAKENLNGKKRIEAILEIMKINRQDCEKVEKATERSQNIVVEMQETLKASEQILAAEKENHEALAKKVAEGYDMLKSNSVGNIDHTWQKIESAIQENVNPDILTRIKKTAGFHK